MYTEVIDWIFFFLRRNISGRMEYNNFLESYLEY